MRTVKNQIRNSKRAGTTRSGLFFFEKKYEMREKIDEMSWDRINQSGFNYQKLNCIRYYHKLNL